jgi:hypothetical protein
MSAVTEHLQQRGSAFELLSHRQADTSTDEARALGIDAGEVLKTLAVRTGPGYALAVIPASCRLDLLGGGRDGLADHLPLEWGEQLVAEFLEQQPGGWLGCRSARASPCSPGSGPPRPGEAGAFSRKAPMILVCRQVSPKLRTSRLAGRIRCRCWRGNRRWTVSSSRVEVRQVTAAG